MGIFGKIGKAAGFDPSRQAREADGKFGRSLTGATPPTTGTPPPPTAPPAPVGTITTPETRETILTQYRQTAYYREPYEDLLRECGGDTAAAERRVPARIRQQQIVDTAPGIVSLDPPGSQADQYILDPDGRPTEVYYASFGSNLSYDRFRLYVEGGQVEGNQRVYDGCRDKTPPADDIPVALPGTLFYAGQSRAWNGGVAFLDTESSGRSLGRAYLITAEQFDDVVCQENAEKPGTSKVDTATVIAEGRKVGPGVYGTLVHVGDHNGRPVVTFTSPFGAADAHAGNLTVTPEGAIADRAARKAGEPARRAAHDKAQAALPETERVPFKEDWDVFSNAPTRAYLNKINEGLVETFSLTPDKLDGYFAGSDPSLGNT